MIREKIDALRKEKNFSWLEIYENLEKELKTKKSEMSNLISNAEEACKEREVLKEEIEIMKIKDEEEEKEYQKQVEELTKLIEKDKQVRDYLKVKKKLNDNDIKQAEATKPPEKTNLKDRIKTEKRIRNKVIEKINDLGPSLSTIQSINEEGMPDNKDLEALLDENQRKKQASSNNTELEKLQEIENQNFRLNYFLTELKQDSETIDKEIEEIKQQIRDAINNDSSQIETQIPSNSSQIAPTEAPEPVTIYDSAFHSQLAKAQAEKQDYEHRIKEADKTINSLKLGIKSIYERIGIDKTDSNEVLKGYTISEGNLMDYLGLIENNATDLVNIYNQSKGGGSTLPTKIGLGIGNKRDDNKAIIVNKALLPDMNNAESKIPTNEKDPQVMTVTDLIKKAYKE